MNENKFEMENKFKIEKFNIKKKELTPSIFNYFIGNGNNSNLVRIVM